MKNVALKSLEDLSNSELEIIKEKFSHGLQMLRLPRCGTTATEHFLNQFKNFNFLNLGSCSFHDIPFSWGPAHHQTMSFPLGVPQNNENFKHLWKEVKKEGGRGIGYGLEKSWIDTFNTPAYEKEIYNPNALTFQIIRNPYDWLTSIYRWDFMRVRSFFEIHFPINTRSPRDFKDPQRHQKFFGKDFEKWVDLLFTSINPDSPWNDIISHPFPWPLERRCFFQGFDSNDKCHVDVYIKYENLEKGMKSLLAALGNNEVVANDYLSISSTQRKKITSKTKFSEYKTAYYKNDHTRDIIKNSYQWDLENFNYSFENEDNNQSILFVGKQ